MRLIKRLFLLLLMASLSGCFYWWRAYQTYQQLDEFDRYFAINVADDFTVKFKSPILYSQDFVLLSKLQPSISTPLPVGRQWRYKFNKVDEQLQPVTPAVRFFFDLNFNLDDRLIAWRFSPLFLQIAPPEFLELSLRSLAGADINQDKRQLRANTDNLVKIDIPLPQKAAILTQLGKPESIEDKQDKEVYLYRFLLDTSVIEHGYEERALSVVKLTFDKLSQSLIKMSGRFAGLKISIDYRKYQAKPAPGFAASDNASSQI